MKPIEEKLSTQLAARQQAGNLRSLSLRQGKFDFCSNDYLGLAQNQALHRQIQEAYGQFREPGNGATGSRLISGNHSYTMELEAALSQLFQSEKTLLFNSGYAANTAILSAVPQKGDTILYDEYIHASLKEGARLSFANRFSFKHNNLEDLERRLKRATGDVFVVAESVYSMDGDSAPLKEMLEISEHYGANLIWDEAHSTGLWGPNGSGIACQENLHERIFARIYTFGKALGVHGACIAGSSVLTDYLINFARPFIYTTALPLHSLVSVREAFIFLSSHPELPATLHQKVALFKSKLIDQKLINAVIPSQSAIQAIKIGGNEQTKKIAVHLQKAGFDVRPILSPTVRQGEERLRICIHAFNANQEIAELTDLLGTAMQHPSILPITQPLS